LERLDPVLKARLERIRVSQKWQDDAIPGAHAED